MCWYLFLQPQLQRKMDFGNVNACLFLILLEPWVLAAYPQASISRAAVNTGKQQPMGTEILTNDELPWVSRCLGTGTRSFLQVRHRAISQDTGSSSQWDMQFPYSSSPTTFPPALPERNRVHLFPGPWKDSCTLRSDGPAITVLYISCLQILQHRDHCV